jgi:hypothetical protein
MVELLLTMIFMIGTLSLPMLAVLLMLGMAFNDNLTK